VTLCVSDTGIRISPGDQHRIFERFYRVDASRSRAVGGTGFGLSIVKHLVQSMGGRIEFESRLGHGSSFSVTLPTAASACG
jgi:signal transduction histidine kinase